MSRYAEGTQVPSDRSRTEIERTLIRYGASGFSYAWRGTLTVIQFEMEGRRVRFTLPLPDQNDPAFSETQTGRQRTESARKEAYEQEVRRRWRALALVIKAKLEAIDTGISTFDDEFLAAIVLPNNQTYGEFAVPQIATVYRTGAMPPLLPQATDAGHGR